MKLPPPKLLGEIVAGLVGYIIMMIGFYRLGGLDYVLIASGIIAWMPSKWTDR